MENELGKHVTSDLASTTKMPGKYENDTDGISQADKTIENAMPKGPDHDPFKTGPVGR
jgi:hypothetical protein